jgi:hypothetical protein
MVILEFFGNVITTILISYLAFTNTLAEKIESLLPSHTPDQTTEEKVAEVTSEFEEADKNRMGRTGILSKILLEHSEFQRAASIASTRDEEVAPIMDGVPLEEAVRGALVNIYCQYKTKQYIRTTTGSGFFINQKGVILTNAHIAQFLLLEGMSSTEHDVTCVIRTGDPATPKYKAELLYISPTWIFENADLISDETPRGTGERDYAMLYVSGSTNETPLPARFPAIPVDVALLSRSISGSSVVTAGYPAGALMRNGANAKLLPVTAMTTVGTLYTFGSNYADIFSVSDSPVGEQGASGGPIVTTQSKNAIGLIVTKGDEAVEGAHSLRALSLSYIDRTIIEETGFSLLQNMQGDVALRGNIFKKAMVPFLAGILEDKIIHKKTE